MLTADQIKKIYAKALAAQTAGRLNEAAKGYGRILKANPNVAEAQFNMGRIAAAQKQIAVGAGHFEAALKLKPGQPEIWRAYLELASHHPNTDNLAKLLGRAGPALDRFPETAFYKGLVAARRAEPQLARECFEAALKAGLVLARAQVEYGIALAALGETDAALAAFDQALALKPADDFALSRKASLLRDTGQIKPALSVAAKAIAAAPKVGAHYHTYSSIAKITSNDPVISQAQSVLRGLKPNDPNAVYLGHALAKAMEDTGQSDQVFTYLDIANRQLAKAYPYARDADIANVAASNDVFARLQTAQQPEALPSREPVPIFVTGMPRSGTTLVEQILSSHSRCAGAGELSVLGKSFQQVLQAGHEDMAQVSDGLGQAGAAYLDHLASRFPGAGFVTDKSISSYNLIGFIRHALPQAKIIVVRRDPGDNALSLYKNLFAQGTHRYAADLGDIARFMRLFESQIAFWRDALPGSFTEIRYEALIAEPEAQSRALVAAAGLDWEDACLSFYDNTRQVETLSSTQVRKPIYSSSVGAWRRFEAQMAPFWDAYGSE